MKLTILEAYDEDVYKDMARIHISLRSGIRRGGLARIAVNGGRSEILAVRGIEREKRDFIRLDFEVRDRLGVRLDHEYDFSIQPTSPFEQITWACRSSEPALRVATWIAIWSAVLGVIGITISVLPLLR
jgi:hypothetical protein